VLLGLNPTRSIFMIVGNYGDVAESDWLNFRGSTIKMTKKATDRNSKIAIVTGIIGSLLLFVSFVIARRWLLLFK
jgi:hypothetical protein